LHPAALHLTGDPARPPPARAQANDKADDLERSTRSLKQDLEDLRDQLAKVSDRVTCDQLAKVSDRVTCDQLAKVSALDPPAGGDTATCSKRLAKVVLAPLARTAC
jgi:hypothetical protein